MIRAVIGCTQQCVAFFLAAAHTAELFATLNVLPLQYNFQFNLIMKYKHSLKFNNEPFRSLCNLRKPHKYQYNIRNRDEWLIPFSRTNHGLNRLEHCMPFYLGRLHCHGIDVSSITRKELKRFLVDNITSNINVCHNQLSQLLKCHVASVVSTIAICLTLYTSLMLVK